MKNILLVMVLWLAGPVVAETAAADGPERALPDLEKIDRSLGKEPAYASTEPMYGLYVLESGTRIWAVLDRSAATSKVHDRLYLDRNGNGDLTEEGECIHASSGERNEQSAFAIGELVDPETGDVHSDVELRVRYGDGHKSGVFLRMKWCGKHWVQGGYAAQPGPYTQFASTPGDAPVMLLAARGPFSFQPWVWQSAEIGAETDLQVFMGHRGRGGNTFCAVTDEFLPAGVPVLATLVYADRSGKEQRVQQQLRARC